MGQAAQVLFKQLEKLSLKGAGKSLKIQMQEKEP
jgi:hypothetical protein